MAFSVCLTQNELVDAILVEWILAVSTERPEKSFTMVRRGKLRNATLFKAASTTSAMRLALLTSYLSPRGGGLFTAVQSLARALLEHARIDLRIFGMLDGGRSTDLRQWKDLEVSAFETGGLMSFRLTSEMLEAIGSFRPDVIHAHGLWTLLSIVGVCSDRRLKVPRIVSPHGMLDPWALSQRPIRKALGAMLYEKSNLRSARCVHATAMAELNAIRQYGLENPVCLVPNAVEIPVLSGVARNDDSNAGARGNVVLVYLGRFHPKKGLASLLKGWALARERHGNRSRNWQLRIAGSDQDNYMSKLQLLVEQLDISESVEFLGPKFGVEKEAFLKNADGLILPSQSEGLPMIVIEAWAHGLPTLVTKHCNVPEGVLAGAALEVGTDPSSICNGINTFMEMDARERRAMAAAARRLAEERFSAPTVATAMRDVYWWAAGGGSPPSSVYWR
jgi:poly(glycerol-phosphate) alpha-glucosyltransferase